MKEQNKQSASEQTLPGKWIKAHGKRKRWQKAVLLLSCIVVFCTTYALILPAITMTEPPLCGLQEHTHDDACYETALVCTQTADDDLDADSEEEPHHHTESCFEKHLICTLTEHEHSEACYQEPAGEQTTPVETEPNADIAEPSQPAETAYVAELHADGSPTVFAAGETVSFAFSLKIAGYDGTPDAPETRIRVEFVLPVSEAEAVFDLEAMTWLDRTPGYEPAVTAETRTFGDAETSCQVLSGYILQTAEEPSLPAPDSFEAAVSVCVREMAAGDPLTVQISAAMAQNTWMGECEIHHTEERLTVLSQTSTAAAVLSEAERQAVYDRFNEEVEALEAIGVASEEAKAAANDLLARLAESMVQRQLSESDCKALADRIAQVLSVDPDFIAEPGGGLAWIEFCQSGWFTEYSEAAAAILAGQADDSDPSSIHAAYAPSPSNAPANDAAQPSGVQIDDPGGEVTSDDGQVSVSKTIQGTDLENVFDITLRVRTSEKNIEVIRDPDLAVVIVLDISNTMTYAFGNTTRYQAAMAAAEQFLDQFAESNALGVSKVGFVAFNTNAKKIFDLQSCSNSAQATVLKNTMRTETGKVLNYADSHERFTNIEGGLKLANNMLKNASNANKFIVFLSDGFPTTYVSSGYNGYDPYCTSGTEGRDGVFYDSVTRTYCLYGTSYSDKAAIRARKMATAIKQSGATIFSIGVDIGGQTVQQYVDQTAGKNFSVVDRTSTSYEIGSATSSDAYKNWLKEKIGSGYYYDSTNSAGLAKAFKDILEQIKAQVAESAKADWVAEDPIPTILSQQGHIEFIGFFDKGHTLRGDRLTGQGSENAENTAAYPNSGDLINWDLKQSGYRKTVNGSETSYTYELCYRVRLQNEENNSENPFVENKIYQTNGETKLQYRTIVSENGTVNVSPPKTVIFPIPSVHGYLADLSFVKTDAAGHPLSGAVFTLTHDTAQCSICRGDGSAVSIPQQTQTSGTDGLVTFTRIPSGHQYRLEETSVPIGYAPSDDTYTVTVAYDVLTITVTSPDGTSEVWRGESGHRIVNRTYYELPQTGGPGILPYVTGGILLIVLSAGLLFQKYRKRSRKGASSS